MTALENLVDPGICYSFAISVSEAPVSQSSQDTSINQQKETMINIFDLISFFLELFIKK